MNPKPNNPKPNPEPKKPEKKVIKSENPKKSDNWFQRMIKYFKEHADLVSAYTQRNPRYIFFRKQQGPPHGSINEPVIAMRTIATDKSIYPRACLAFISTTLPRLINGKIFHDPYSGFALDQDTGGAIQAAGRCDVYMGQGEVAGKLAGQIYREGRLYYLFLKPGYQKSLLSSQPPQAQ